MSWYCPLVVHSDWTSNPVDGFIYICKDSEIRKEKKKYGDLGEASTRRLIDSQCESQLVESIKR